MLSIAAILASFGLCGKKGPINGSSQLQERSTTNLSIVVHGAQQYYRLSKKRNESSQKKTNPFNAQKISASRGGVVTENSGFSRSVFDRTNDSKS